MPNGRFSTSPFGVRAPTVGVDVDIDSLISCPGDELSIDRLESLPPDTSLFLEVVVGILKDPARDADGVGFGELSTGSSAAL